MPNYTLVHTSEIENKAGDGEFKMLKGDLGCQQVTISLRTFTPHSGQRGKGGHKHQKIEEVLYVVKGTLIIKLDDEELKLVAGDALRIAPEVMRAYQNDADQEAVIILASPVLEGQQSDGIHSENFWAD